MSRSYKKVNKVTICCVSLRRMRKWKHHSTKHRRVVEKRMLYVDDDGNYQDDKCYKFKYQHDMATNDWTGPHDGYVKYFGKTRK